jgi:alpha-galactosidase
MLLPRRLFLGGMTAAAPAMGAARRLTPAAPEVLAAPDYVAIRSGGGRLTALSRGGSRWTGEGGVAVGTEPRRGGKGVELPVTLAAPGAEVEHICLRWRGTLPAHTRFLGDHWERSYGDLEWRGMTAHRVMPWYFLAFDERAGTTAGFGVKTGARSIAFWQADAEGITLWLDVRNGGRGVRLGERVLEAAVVRRTRAFSQRPFAAAGALCRQLCDTPRLAAQPVYGGNNWYYTYGRDFTAEDIVRDSELLAGFAPAGTANRPFMVIDMGWAPGVDGAGPTSRGNAVFPDMAGLAARMRRAGARAGIWIRPLLTAEKPPDGWRLQGGAGRERSATWVLDPSVPEVLEYLRNSVAGIRGWGFELIKHDYSTYDIFGRWGFQMGPQFTAGGWGFADGSRTSAEIVGALYGALREAAGDATMLLGCNTIGHLGAGLFEIQRIGDDTSGKQWERTRKMGVNTLAFRLPQHNTFFAADADCVPVTAAIPWAMTRQWLDLVARSGTPLFVSPDPKMLDAEARAAIKAAFAIAAVRQAEAEPLDWMDSTAPAHWRFGNGRADYRWAAPEGSDPFAG